MPFMYSQIPTHSLTHMLLPNTSVMTVSENNFLVLINEAQTGLNVKF